MVGNAHPTPVTIGRFQIEQGGWLLCRGQDAHATSTESFEIPCFSADNVTSRRYK
jgi:hypothetical protein